MFKEIAQFSEKKNQKNDTKVTRKKRSKCRYFYRISSSTYQTHTIEWFYIVLVSLNLEIYCTSLPFFLP